jgi:hypothetical protein
MLEWGKKMLLKTYLMIFFSSFFFAFYFKSLSIFFSKINNIHYCVFLLLGICQEAIWTYNFIQLRSSPATSHPSVDS